MKKNRVISSMVWSMVALTWLITFVFYRYLPERIPMHWNIYGQVDSWSDKFPGAFIMPAVVLFIATLFSVLPKIDPRKMNYEKFAGAYQWMKLILVATFFILNIIVLYASVANGEIKVDVLVKLTIGILFIVIGNLMPKIKNNFFVGIKTPWTLANETVWFKTHRLGGILWFVTGVIMSVLAFVSGEVSAIMYFSVIIIATIVPLVYSYICYKRIS